MNYLLLDLAKVKISNKKIPYHKAKIGLMVTAKQAKQLITPEEPHSVYVLPAKKAVKSIKYAVEEILVHQPKAQIIIVSSRKKLNQALLETVLHYPDATIKISRKLDKKTRRFFKKTALKETAINNQSKQLSDDNNHEKQLITQIEQNIQAALTRIMPNTSKNTIDNSDDEKHAQIIHNTLGKNTHDAVFTYITHRIEEIKDDQELIAIMRMLKKNRPKKKNDLVRLIGDVHHGSQKAQDLVIKLQNQGFISIDAAENIKYK